MKNQFKFMPLYWNDYLLDTEHLTGPEHGAYLLLIGYYWRTGSALPDDDLLLSRVARTEMEAWKAMKATICRFFYFEDGFWRHKRVEAEFKACREISERNRNNVLKRYGKERCVVVQLPDNRR